MWFRLYQSLLLRVALAWAALLVGGLYFVAIEFAPNVTFIASDGQSRHVFASSGFIKQIVTVYVILLPFIYVGARFFKMVIPR
jgi:hypothetical protein